MTTNFSTVINTPNPQSGIEYIKLFNEFVLSLYNYKSREIHHSIFDIVYCDKEIKAANADGFINDFLKVEEKKQVLLLRHCFSDLDKLEYPIIDKMEPLIKEYGEYNTDIFTPFTIRGFACVRGLTKDWDAYPHTLLWVKKWCQYSVSSLITESIGSFTKWINYYNSLEETIQIEVLQSIMYDFNNIIWTGK